MTFPMAWMILPGNSRKIERMLGINWSNILLSVQKLEPEAFNMIMFVIIILFLFLLTFIAVRVIRLKYPVSDADLNKDES